MRTVGIYHHLGLGDTIECNAIVRKYCSECDWVYIFSKRKNFFMVKELYKDLRNLNIVCITDDPVLERQEVEAFFNKNLKMEKIIVGHEKYFPKLNEYEKNGLSCSEAFYDIAGVPYNLKYENFFYERDHEEEERVFNKLNPTGEKFIFVHDDPTRGYNISIDSKLKIVKNDTTENMFNMLLVLERAEEIQCMSSSFFCLIDCLSKQTKFNKLYLHRGIRNVFAGKNSFSQQWNIIE
jgi:hypothetical protein